MKEIPPPGSDEALDLGCTCPVLDNAHGKGIGFFYGQQQFYIDYNCPLHGDKDEQTEETI